jgi:hypothetical protein
MSAHLARRAPRAITAGVATCAIALATAAPGFALPAGPGAAHRAGPGAHQPPASEDLRSTAQTGSLAGTTEANLPAITGERARISAPDDGATTLAVVLIAAGAMVAGASAGFAGGRHGVLRTH